MGRHTRGVVFVAALAAAVVPSAAAGGAAGFLEPDVEVLTTLHGDEAGDSYGWAGADLGDLDHDGAGDYAVTAIFDGSGGPAAGRAVVYSGATGALLADHLGTDEELLGWAVSTAGDVDADGTPDYVIGAPGLPPGFGTAQPGRALVVSGDDHAVIWQLASTAPTFFGAAVSGAGDLNRDGHDDVLVGATSAADGRGEVVAYSGRDAGVLWTAVGAKAGDGLGSATGRVGDVDGDGIPDQAAGASGAKRGRGTAYVLSGADGHRIHQLNPQGDGQQFARFFASGAGDVDGDGVGDVFVGDYAAGHVRGRASRIGDGAAYVFSGATGARICRFDAPSPGDGFGVGRGVGDLDGDGHADLLIAGYTASAGAPQAGQATLYSGADGRVLRTITSTREGENLGVDALCVGDVDGDGLPDFLLTAAGRSFTGQEPGRAYVIAGTPVA